MHIVKCPRCLFWNLPLDKCEYCEADISGGKIREVKYCKWKRIEKQQCKETDNANKEMDNAE